MSDWPRHSGVSVPESFDRLIPHRPPFRFVDDVLEVGDESAELVLRLVPGDARLTNGRLAPLFLIEALAQAAAAFHGLKNAGTPEAGMLVQLDRVQLLAAACEGDEVHLTVRRTHTLGALVRFDGRVRVADCLLAAGELTVARSFEGTG